MVSSRTRRLTASTLLAEYARGRREFRHVDIRRIKIQNGDLTGALLFGARLEGADLSYCTLTHVQLKAANVRRANLTHAQLNATDLIAGDFTDSNFVRADLTGAALHRAILVRADLSGANLGGAQLSEANFAGATLKRTHLYHTVFCDLDASPFCDEPDLEHAAPSYIDYRTVLKSHHHPRFRQFMTDCGVPSLFSEFMIDCARASDRYALTQLMQSTFISYGAP